MVWLCDDRGERLYPFGSEFVSLNYTRVVNGAGKLHGFAANAEGLEQNLVGLDYQLQVWRLPEGGSPYLDFVAYIRHWKWTLDAGGAVRLVIEDCQDQNEFLARRKVAYKSGTAQAIASGEAADDAMKRIFDENFLAGATDSERVMSLVTVEGDDSAGPLLDKGFSFQPVLELFQEISQETRQAGNEVFFALVISDVDYAGGWLAYQFQTFTGQPGVDKTWDTDSPVIFGRDFENIEEMQEVYDYRAEENAVYVAGQGVGERRTVIEVEDEEAQAASAWNRREGFVDARDVENAAQDAAGDTNAVLQARGQQRLNESRPTVRISGRIRSTEHTLYGRDWTLGDRVTVKGLKGQFDALIRVVNVQVERGVERITGLVEAEL